jgi:hypothetical protein
MIAEPTFSAASGLPPAMRVARPYRGGPTKPDPKRFVHLIPGTCRDASLRANLFRVPSLRVPKECQSRVDPFRFR